MSKRSIALLAVLGGLVLLVGVYVFLQVRPKPAAASTEAKPDILKLDKEQLVKMVLTDRSEGTLTLVKKDKSWTVAGASYQPALAESSVDDLVASFTFLTAERVISDNPTDLAQYGLKPPKAVAEAFLADGTVQTILLGDKTPVGNTYYLMKKGDPKVYSVWMNHGEHFHWTIDNLRSTSLAPVINPDEITWMRLRLRGGQTLEVVEKTPEEQAQYQLGFGKYLVTKPYPQPRGVDSEKFDPVMRGPSGIQIDAFVEDTPKSLAPYGLDHPWGEAAVRDKSNSLDLLFGADRGADQVYFMVAGRPEVYAVNKYRITFMDTKPFDVVDKFVFIPNIDDIDRVVITEGGRSHELAIARVTKKAEKAGDPDEVVATYTADGTTVQEDYFKKFYQALIGLTVDGEAPRQVPNKPDLTVRYLLNKGARRDVTITFAPYDKVFDAVFVDGQGGFALTAEKLARMRSKLDDLLAGREVTDQ